MKTGSESMDKDLLESITLSMTEVYGYESVPNKLFIAKLNLSKFQQLLTLWPEDPEKEAIEDHVRWLECNIRESFPEIPDEFIPLLATLDDGYDNPDEEKCKKFYQSVSAAKKQLGLGKISG